MKILLSARYRRVIIPGSIGECFVMYEKSFGIITERGKQQTFHILPLATNKEKKLARFIGSFSRIFWKIRSVNIALT